MRRTVFLFLRILRQRHRHGEEKKGSGGAYDVSADTEKTRVGRLYSSHIRDHIIFGRGGRRSFQPLKKKGKKTSARLFRIEPLDGEGGKEGRKPKH